MRAIRLLVLVFLASLCAGCESWYAPNVDEQTVKPVRSAFQRLRMLPDSVVLEVAVAQIDLDQLDQFDHLWNRIDTGVLSLHDRRVLDQNGIRVGVLSSHVPAELHELLAPIPVDESSLNPWQEQLLEKGLLKPQSRFLLHDGIQNRRGETHPVPVSQFWEQTSWVVHSGDRKSVGAGENVRAVVEVKTFPKGDGTVRLICTPTLHIGLPRTQIGVSQQAFAYETSQDKKQLSDLKFEACLRSGETLIVAPTSDLGDLGKLFFGADPGLAEVANDGSPQTYRILMLRLLQTQKDDLFDADTGIDELTTTFTD